MAGRKRRAESSRQQTVANSENEDERREGSSEERHVGVENARGTEPTVRDETVAHIQERRQRMKESMEDAARKRASHFATFDTGSSAGGEQGVEGSARTLGPWSTAIQLADGLQAAKAKREEDILKAKRKTDEEHFAYHSWTPTRNDSLHAKNEVGTLRSLSLRLVADLIEYVESLWGLPDDVRNSLAGEVCRRRKMKPDVFKVFMQQTQTEVCIPDCSFVDEENMLPAVLEALNGSLRTLELGFCGRGFTDSVAKALAEQGLLSSLETLKIGSAYQLTDHGCLALLKRTKCLKTLSLYKCSRIEGDVIGLLPEVTPHITCLDIAWCSAVPRKTLAETFQKLDMLQVMRLDGLVDIDDKILCQGALNGLNSLKSLSIAQCHKVTDMGLKAICGNLQGLVEIILDESQISTAGIISLVDSCPELKVVSLKRCVQVTDDAVMYMAEHLDLHKVNLNGVVQITGASVDSLARNCRHTLEELDISWCRNVPAKAVGYLADSCGSLAKLHAWGCTTLDPEVLQGHSNSKLEIIGRGEELIEIDLRKLG